MKRLVEFLRTPRGWRKATIPRCRPTTAAMVRVGLLLNLRACWIGVHHSKEAKRTCINLVPFLTIWITLPGGIHP